MSDLPPRTHNLPSLSESLDPEVLKAIIDDVLEVSPLAVDGTRTPSIRARDQQLVDSCRRFIRAYPVIKTDEGERIATEILSLCQRYAGGTGRVEKARERLKRPVIAASKQIDAAFGRLGQELMVRPLTGPAAKRRIAPLTLAETISERLASKKDEDARVIREAAEEAAQKADAEAQLARDLAAKGSGMVGADDVASAEAMAARERETATAPMNKLTRTSGNVTGSSSGRRVRLFEIVDPSLVPRELCTPSDQLIRAAMGAADSPMPETPGVVYRDVTDLNRR